MPTKTTYTTRKRTFSRWEDGDMRWTPFLLWFGALTLLGIIMLAPEIQYCLTHRFWNSGIWMVLGTAACAVIGWRVDVYYRDNQDSTGLNYVLFVAVAGFWGPLFGISSTLRLDREGGIPDVSVYYSNGRIKNATDPSKANYYFNMFNVTGADSVYITQYGEEPGYNWIWRSVVGDEKGKTPKSHAPRADEDTWQRPLPRETIKLLEKEKRLEKD